MTMGPILERLRKDLLDLTRRNRLLNFKGAGRTSLDVVDELADEVWRVLVTEGRAMQFLAREEGAAGEVGTVGEVGTAGEEVAEGDEVEVPVPADGAPPSPRDADVPREWEGTRFDYAAALDPARLAPLEPPEKDVAPRHRDEFLQTDVEGEALQARLVHLAREARSSLEERGANTLFLTLGMVEWSDAQTPSTPSRAPLLFLPVRLLRRNVNSRHKATLLDEEVVVNPCLLELARRHHRVELPAAEVEAESFTPSGYFATVRTALEEVPGWSIADEIHVGLFSFAKLLLYHDLDADRWPAERRLADHPIVRLLAGVGTSEGLEGKEVPDPRTIDERVAPADCFQVVDADSSQQAAILAARDGASLVIQGPPGTGKSQTITNIIAECMAAGRSVLFVAEKAAALEVVHRRLKKVGLGEFVLELHSRSASKRAVVEELGRALDEGGANGREVQADGSELERSRDALNRYVRALHHKVGALERSPYEAAIAAGAYRSAPEGAFDVGDPFAWTKDELDRTIEAIAALDRRLARIGDPAAHPWRGSRLTSAGLEVRQRITDRRGPVVDAVRRVGDEAVALTEGLKVEVPGTAAHLARLLDDVERLAEMPAAVATVVDDERFDRTDAALDRFIELGLERLAARAKWRDTFSDDAEDVDWSEVLLRRRVAADSWWRFLKPSWHSDTRRLKAFSAGALPSPVEQVERLRHLAASRKLRREIEAEGPALADRLGGLYAGADSDFDALLAFVAAAREMRTMIRGRSLSRHAILRILEAGDRFGVRERVARGRSALDDFRRAVVHWLETVDAVATAWFGDDLDRTSIAEVQRRFAELETAEESLQDWVDYQGALADLAGPRLKPFLLWALGRDGRPAWGRLSDAFLRQFLFIFADRALEAAPELVRFRGEDHERLIERFRALDRRWLDLSRRRLQSLLARRRPDFGHDASRESKLGILKHEMRKKRRHMPLRRLFELCGDVVQAMKPCFMMSPISVAQYLAPGRLTFDVVIFDEASQVEPADAFGAIARGNQLLLIGDEKQLPPTNFFNRIEGEGNDGGAGVDEGEAAAADLESVLGLGAVRFPPRSTCSLRWHYRSLHESLIDFSNARFYDHRLRIFPSPRTDRGELGLSFRLVEGAVYRRGLGVNPEEARVVAAAVIEHATKTPESSLGVGAFSVAQQRVIEDEVERLRRGDARPEVEEFFRGNPHEPFFVKNLETIQGDERDVILLSVGYGRDQDGKVSMNFGPLNRDGGWRRLNVLVTRARRRLVVFSSITADDVRVSANSPLGIAALKSYLATAAAERLVDVDPGEEVEPSPLADAVRRALTERGWDVRSNVGCTDFHVDLAILDPGDPTRFLCGIECDGPLYRDAATARDRDRTRPEVLRARGWAIERVWSADWFRRPTAVADALHRRLDELRLAPRDDAAGTEPTESPDAVDVAVDLDLDLDGEDDRPGRDASESGGSAPGDGDAPLPDVVPYRSAKPRRLGDGEALRALSPQKLARTLAAIVKEEGPIHRDEALRVLIGYFDTRATKHPREAFDRALVAATTDGLIALRDPFLWPVGLERTPVRRRGDDCAITDPDSIPPEEIEEAVLIVLRREIGVPRVALAARVGALIGFRRASTKLTDSVDRAVASLLERREVGADAAGFLTLTGGD